MKCLVVIIYLSMICLPSYANVYIVHRHGNFICNLICPAPYTAVGCALCRGRNPNNVANTYAYASSNDAVPINAQSSVNIGGSGDSTTAKSNGGGNGSPTETTTKSPNGDSNGKSNGGSNGSPKESTTTSTTEASSEGSTEPTTEGSTEPTTEGSTEPTTEGSTEEPTTPTP